MSVRVYYAGRSVEPAEVVTRDDGSVVLVLSVDDADDPGQVDFVHESAISHIDVLRKPRSTTSRAPIGFSVHREDE